MLGAQEYALDVNLDDLVPRFGIDFVSWLVGEYTGGMVFKLHLIFPMPDHHTIFAFFLCGVESLVRRMEQIGRVVHSVPPTGEADADGNLKMIVKRQTH